MDKYDPTTSAPAPGESVNERMAFWRTLTWEELVSYMTCAEGELLPRAERLSAPGVDAQLRRE
jgi:hypothetical protein